MSELLTIASKIKLKMLRDGPFFNICIVEDLCSSLGVESLAKEEDLKGLRLLHTVNYADMPPGSKDLIMAAVFSLLRLPLNYLDEPDGQSHTTGVG